MENRIANIDDGSYPGTFKYYQALQKSAGDQLWLPGHGHPGKGLLKDYGELMAGFWETCLKAVEDGKDLSAAKALVLRLWGARVHEAEARIYNPKSALQQRSQAQGLGLPVYTETARSGPDHQPMFTIEVRLDNGLSASATAAGKRVAEAAAAEALLAQMENDP